MFAPELLPPTITCDGSTSSLDAFLTTWETGSASKYGSKVSALACNTHKSPSYASLKGIGNGCSGALSDLLLVHFQLHSVVTRNVPSIINTDDDDTRSDTRHQVHDGLGVVATDRPSSSMAHVEQREMALSALGSVETKFNARAIQTGTLSWLIRKPCVGRKEGRSALA